MGYTAAQLRKTEEILRQSDYETVSVRLAVYKAKQELADKQYNHASGNERKRAYARLYYSTKCIALCEKILFEKENNYGY